MHLACIPFMVKNRQGWLPELHRDQRTPHEQMLVTKPWQNSNTEELRQHIIHPLGNFPKISPHWCRGGFLCLLSIGGRGKTEEKNLSCLTVTLTVHHSHCDHAHTPAPALHARAHVLTGTSHTPTTSESAHQADNHSGNWAQPKPLPPQPVIS